MSSSLKHLNFEDEAGQPIESTHSGKEVKFAPTFATNKESPATCVVGVETFRAWFSQLSSSLPATMAVENAQVLKNHCRDLREQLRKMPMPAAIDVGLRKELYALCQAGPVSVRSTATIQDRHGVSSTATHDTYVGVVGADAIIARIIDCFVSMWDDKAVQNRSRQGVDPAQIDMTVVVMAGA